MPFGPTAYGVSTSWFLTSIFMLDFLMIQIWVITWDSTFDKLSLGIGYFLMSEPQTIGSSLKSSRYAYDVVSQNTKVDSTGVVNEDANENTEDKENGFDEQHQFNIRAIYTLADIADVGVSLQYGLLKGTNVGNDDSGNED